MRVTAQQSYNSMNNAFSQLSENLQHVVSEMATGKKLLLPSDDPIAATRVTQLNREQSAIDQYQSNITTVSSSLAQQESILDSVNNTLLSLRDDLLAAQSGTLNSTDLNSYGQEIQSGVDSIVAALNYQDQNGNYIFGGTINNQQPITYDDTDNDGEPDTYVYNGNDEHREATVSNGITVDTNVTVGEMLGDGLDALNTLNNLAQELQQPDVNSADVSSDITNAINVLDQASTGVNNAIASLGQTQNTLTMLSGAQTGVSTTNAQLMDELTSLQYGPAVVQFSGMKVAMEAMMKTYSQVSGLSLFNVL